jgi:photosystem II stability/assembly factor-like uncharacterized protein
VYATTKTNGVYKSTDNGLTFTPINNGITNQQMGRAAPVIVHPHNDRILYVASEGGGGVYKSTDAGNSWFEVNYGLADLSVHGIDMDKSDPDVLYVSGPHGVWRTRTAGEKN